MKRNPEHHQKILSLIVAAVADRGMKIRFRHRKLDGTIREVFTDRIKAEESGLLRYFCNDKMAWRCAAAGTLISVQNSPEVSALARDIGSPATLHG